LANSRSSSAAWDVHQARLFGRCEPTTGIAPFGRLVAQVMGSEPYASARQVFWVVDNGSSHREQASVERLEGAWPNLRLVHLPVHASWLNQVEIYFSVVQRKVLTPNDFTDLGDLKQRLLAFQRRYQQTAVPFNWRFGKADLNALLRRLAERERLARAA
jgi:DDE superfamily endonuclease